MGVQLGRVHGGAKLPPTMCFARTVTGIRSCFVWTRPKNQLSLNHKDGYAYYRDKGVNALAGFGTTGPPSASFRAEYRVI